MRKLLNRPWFVAALVIVAIASIGLSQLDRGRLGGADSVAGDSLVEYASGDLTGEDGDLQTPAVRLSVREALAALVIPANLSDPFAPRARTADAEAIARDIPPDRIDTLHLSAVWSQAETLLVLVNDRIARVGDVIGRLTIETITLDGIWVHHWRGRDFVPIGGDFTLITPATQEPATTTTAASA